MTKADEAFLLETGWDYEGTVLRWVDGDTVWMTVSKQLDTGFRVLTTVQQTMEFRVWGMNADDRGQPNYKAATARVNALCPPGQPLRVKTFKPRPEDQYKRWLVRVMIAGDRWLDETMIEEGLARPYFGGPRT